jgi:hypothetical protein
MSNVVQLEAFEAPLHSRRIRWFLSAHAPAAYPPGFKEQCFLESPPFTKRILLASSQSSEAWKVADRWDVVFVPSTPADWSLALTVLLHQPSPAIVILTPECRAPSAFFQKLTQAGSKAPLVVQFAFLTVPPPPPQITFDATFFPPARKLEDVAIEATQLIFQQVLSSHILQNFTLKDAIRDLKAAGASFVISSIGDPEPTIYWYYATEQKSKANDVLSATIQTLLLRDV